jgi:hypothetical protein
MSRNTCIVLSVEEDKYSKKGNEQERGNTKRDREGLDVMIAIFCDFRQFSAKKLAFFSKANVTIKILHNLALF